MQERLKIQKQLQKLREECVKEYLETNLQAITSKEVIHDILMDFLQANNKQFMENISNSISEVKEANKQLKEDMQTMKIQQALVLQNEINKERTQSRMVHEKVLKQLTMQKDVLKEQFQQENLQFNRKMMQIIQQNEIINAQKQQIQKNLFHHLKNNQLLQMEIQDMKAFLSNQNVSYSSERIKYEQRIQSYESHLAFMQNKQRQDIAMHQQILRKIKEQFKNFQEEEKISKVQYEYTINRQLQMINSLKDQKRRTDEAFDKQMTEKRILSEQVNKLVRDKESLMNKNKEVEYDVQRACHQLEQTKQSLENYRQENNYLLSQIQQATTSFKFQVDKHQLEVKNIKIDYQKERKEMQNLILQRQESLSKMMKENERISLQNANLQRLMTQKQRRISNISEQKDSMAKQLLQLKENDQKNLEQIKSLMSYNNIQNEQLQSCEQEINKLRRQKQQCMIKMQQHEISLNGITLELKSYSDSVIKLNETLVIMEQQLGIQRQKQRYYNLYMEEIAFLKKQLLKYRPNKNQFLYSIDSSLQVNKIQKKSKFYLHLFKLKQELNGLKRQNDSIRLLLKQLVFFYRQVMDRDINTIVGKVQSECLKCLYCHHKESNMNINIKQTSKLSFDKTIPKHNSQAVKYSSIKKNLKTIQHKYQQVNQQNTQFMTYIDHLLKKE